MVEQLLTPELVITLKEINVFGNKTILSMIGKNITTPDLTLKDLFFLIESIQEKDVRKGAGTKRIHPVSYNELKEASDRAKNIIEQSMDENISIVTYYDSLYPEMLRKCEKMKDLTPPVALYYRGDIKVLDAQGIAIIGTRQPTPNGLKAAKFLALEFAKRGFNIVSGLAIGCDASAHAGALVAKGKTTAILANGLGGDSIYPKKNRKLAEEIVANGGLLLSEYPIGQACTRYGLVTRDRLQVALACAIVVVQTGITGGTMHAVEASKKSKKPLFVVDFHADHDKLEGNLKLLEEAALPLRSSAINEVINIINGKRPY